MNLLFFYTFPMQVYSLLRLLSPAKCFLYYFKHDLISGYYFDTLTENEVKIVSDTWPFSLGDDYALTTLKINSLPVTFLVLKVTALRKSSKRGGLSYRELRTEKRTEHRVMALYENGSQ